MVARFGPEPPVPLRPTILCVDDEPNVLEVLKRLLERSCQVVTANSGAEALEVLRTRRIDLLLTDQKMPGMTGIELIRKTRSEGREVLAILLTAYTNPADLIAAINEGQVYRYVTKPWDLNDLSMTVKNALELVALRREKERLLESLRKRVDALSVMYEVSRQASADGWTLEAIVDRLLATVGRVLPHDLSVVLLESGEGRTASLRIQCEVAASESALLHVKETVLQGHKKVAGVHLTEERVITKVTGPAFPAGQGLDGFPGSLSVQLVSQGRVVGSLSLFSARPDAYTPDDGELLDLLVNQTTDTITQVRGAERENRLRLERMVDALTDGVVLTDEKGEVVVANAAARLFLGVQGEDPREVLDQLQQKLGFSPYDMVRGWEYGGRKTLNDVAEVEGRQLQISVGPVAEAGKALRGVLVTLHDATAARQLQLRKDEFISVVSHELRTPLTSISGAIDLILNNLAGDVSDKQRRFLSMAKESTERLNALVDDLLDLSKFEQGRLKLYVELVDLGEVVRRAVERYAPSCGERELTVKVELPPEPVRALADPNRLGQVLNNLLTNAVKFAHRGGALTVSLATSPDAPGLTTLTVWNSGDAIPEESLERIFDRFEQARTAKNRGVPGTGLGLSISRQLVEAHGGRIWAEPCAEGARFVVVLPAEPPPEGTTAPASETTVPPRGTVLVVEDDRHLAWIIKAVLMAKGFRVVLAHTGDEALTRARALKPDVISIDQRLPDAQGLELLQIFRHDPDTRQARLLLLSGANVREDAERAGAHAVLKKPLGLDALVATVEGLLSTHREGRGRVLVVDDDPRIVAICCEVLANLGFSTERAGTVAETRQKIRAFRPDLLLLDVALPDGDGFGLMEELKADRASGPLSVIFISARADTSAKVRALKLGGDDYLTKPFDAIELGARVESVLRRRAADALSSPTTQLPGSGAIEREVQTRLQAGTPFAFCYLDLDNLKAYNDYYGFAKADGVVKQTGDLLREVFSQHGKPGDFVGHVAGDDFVFLTRQDAVDELCGRIIDGFDRIIPLYYDGADRERGYIEAEDRYGQRRRFPIMSVSIVTVIADGSLDHAELARQAAELKHRAKAVPGSVYLRSDRPEPVRGKQRG